jgi:ribosomal protein L7Ae-like RNA K-turn-binding protein
VGDPRGKTRTHDAGGQDKIVNTGSFHNQEYPEQASAVRVLNVGISSHLIAEVLEGRADEFEVTQSKGTAETIALVIRNRFDFVLVDQSVDNDAMALLVPLLASSEHSFKLLVISQPQQVGKYLRIQGVDRVFTTPVARNQLRHAFGIRAGRTATGQQTAAEMPGVNATGAAELFGIIRSRAISSISSLYKNAAFILLGILFFSFCFYGLLIGYFLVASNWAAPVTLSPGHEFVAKVEQQINDLRVNANLTGQRASEAELEASKAARANEDARILVGYMLGTVKKEIENRKANRITLAKSVKRIEGLKRAFEKQLRKSGMSKQLEELFEKHVIDRKAYNSATLGLLEAGQRLSGLEGDLEVAQDGLMSFDSGLEMLQSLKLQLESGKMDSIRAATEDLILLTKQAVDARSAFDQSRVQMASAKARLELLANSKKLLEKRIAALENSALGRAVTSRVDVLFVPYGNEENFKAGTALYSCRLTIIFCHRAGQVGERVPGESNAVHPFFGKPIRGFFVEAKLEDENAASQEIIHAVRPPFLF